MDVSRYLGDKCAGDDDFVTWSVSRERQDGCVLGKRLTYQRRREVSEEVLLKTHPSSRKLEGS